jgi:hypothetical protein
MGFIAALSTDNSMLRRCRRIWAIVGRFGSLRYKPYPSNYYTHAGIDGRAGADPEGTTTGAIAIGGACRCDAHAAYDWRAVRSQAEPGISL